MQTTVSKFIITTLLFIPLFLFMSVGEVEAGCTFLSEGWNMDSCSVDNDCPIYCYVYNSHCLSPDPPWRYGKCWDVGYKRCVWGGCRSVAYWCDSGNPCGGGGGGWCFVEGTEINTEQESGRAGEQEGTEKIERLKPGDVVSSFNPETGEISESQVSEVHKITREGYYELETESGKKVKVTGEHPFLAVEGEENLISKLKNVLSNTLTYRLIISLRTKLGEVW